MLRAYKLNFNNMKTISAYNQKKQRNQARQAKFLMIFFSSLAFAVFFMVLGYISAI